MNALPYYEPHKFFAVVLALLVHGAFLFLLYFSFNWHVKTPPSMMVEMWDKLPEPAPEIAPEPPLPPPPAPAKIEPPVVLKAAELIAPPKADIEIKEKKKGKAERAKKEKASKQDEKARQQELERQRTQAAQTEIARQRAQEEQQQRDKQRADEDRAARENARIKELKAKMRAEMDAATQGEVARYKDLIQAKIRRHIVMPPDVAENAEAIFLIVVLPGGLVMDNPQLLKSSGNTAYDNAAERAIYKAQPLPLPQDATVARMFRELRLSVKP